MNHPRKRARAAAAQRDFGFDVWLPALVALAAAIFMLTSAHAQVAGAEPRAIYDTERFAADAVIRETAEADTARAAASYAGVAAAYARSPAIGDVTVAALPDLSAAPTDGAPRPPTSAHIVDRSVVIGRPGDGAMSLGRLVAGGLIAALLLLALVALGRTWRRTDGLAV